MEKDPGSVPGRAVSIPNEDVGGPLPPSLKHALHEALQQTLRVLPRSHATEDLVLNFCCGVIRVYFGILNSREEG